MTPIVDLVFESSQWGQSKLGCRKLVPDIVALAWINVPHRPKGTLPELTVTLTDDARIRVLNKAYRKKNKATNVLSFPDWDKLSDIPDHCGPVPVGDIIIAYETVRREAAEQGKSLKNHFIHLVIHGFLHLLGYDHMTDDEAYEMEALETRILKKLDIPDPYL